ncbi:MAG TPA: TonB-dependent receptor, partial [Bacteroidetes bacterium]|nr:TonB-dependent receptor [Bacteroidota bacterium]HEX04396.1 TonB-dependent receptor [Bacteroidota bacterium]
GALAQNQTSRMGGETNTPAFVLVDVGTDWTLNQALSLEIKAENLFDTAYSEHLDWGGALRPGRTFRVTLRMNTRQAIDE